MCTGRGLINFPKAFLLRFLALKNEEEEKKKKQSESSLVVASLFFRSL